MHKNLKHLSHYFSLITIFAAGIIGFYAFSYDRSFQLSVLIALALSYISWGIIHHTIHKDICLAIVLEYIVVAILGVVMVFSLIFRS
jgi:hypothetical protein